jgi:uncharacterized protein YneF (UPF0154 family)
VTAAKGLPNVRWLTVKSLRRIGMQSLARWVVEVAIIALLMLACLVVGIRHGIAEGRNTAMKEALKTNPPSEELEMTCAALWIGEQNMKYHNKERRSAR